jgi:hypothetical protein
VKVTGHVKAIQSCLEDFIVEAVRPSLAEAARHIAGKYRETLRKIQTKPGNSGVRAFTAVGTKTKVFADGKGAYAIVGAKTVGGRMLAPQMRFGEKGTNPRYTKLGKYRGIMPTERWLQLSILASLETAQQVLAAGIKRRARS